MTPSGTHSLGPLHENLTKMARYLPPCMFNVLCGINIAANRKRSAFVSRAHPFPSHLSTALSPVIDIGNYVWLNGSALVWLFVLDLIQITSSWLNPSHWFLTRFNSQVPDLIILSSYWLYFTVNVQLYLTLSFQLSFTLRFRLAFTHRFRPDSSHVFYWKWLSFNYLIQLMFNAITFNFSRIIWVPLQSGFRESHSGQDVLIIIQDWNRSIFHNYDNSNLL